MPDIYIADISARATGEWHDAPGARMVIKAGALTIALELNDRARRELAAALLWGERTREVSAHVQVGPLTLPRGMREIDEQTLHCRKVESQATGTNR